MPNGVKNDWERLPKKPSKQKEFRSHQAKLLGRLAKIVNPTDLRSGQTLNTSLTNSAKMPEVQDGKVDKEWELSVIQNSEYKSMWKPQQMNNSDYKDMQDIPRNVQSKYCLNAKIQKQGMTLSRTTLSPKTTKECDNQTQDITKATDKIQEEKETEDIEDQDDKMMRETRKEENTIDQIKYQLERPCCFHSLVLNGLTADLNMTNNIFYKTQEISGVLSRRVQILGKLW